MRTWANRFGGAAFLGEAGCCGAPFGLLKETMRRPGCCAARTPVLPAPSAEADVSRKAFRRHFDSKYAAAQWCWKRCANTYLLRVGRDLTWCESPLGNFRLVETNIASFSTAALESGYDPCVEYGYRTRVQTLEDVVVNHIGARLTGVLPPDRL